MNLKRGKNMNEMKKMTYYVVELSFRKNNPIHRAICFHRIDGQVELFGSYEGVITRNIKDLTFFKVVDEIPSMTEPFPNKYKLPGSVRKEAEIVKKEMVIFKRGYYENSQRMNEWAVDGKLIKSSFNGANIAIIDGEVSEDILKQMQEMVDKSVIRSETHGD
jgi:hypothetical protein